MSDEKRWDYRPFSPGLGRFISDCYAAILKNRDEMERKQPKYDESFAQQTDDQEFSGQ